MQRFTNSALHVSQTKQTIYECLANEDATVHNLMITNNSKTETIKINLTLEKNNDSFYCIPSEMAFGPERTLELKPINLVSGDKLTITGDVDGVCDVVASILKEVLDF
jgi:ATP-dependent helicase/DNAse subunit B